MNMRIGATLALLAAFAATPALADKINLAAAMSGKDQVPANQTAGSGSATATFDTQTRMLTWEVQYKGLTGPITAAHFHGPAAAGANAGVAVPIGKAGDASPMKGTATLTEAQAADLMAGRWYVNVHTDANKGGEIRGQVMKK